MLSGWAGQSPTDLVGHLRRFWLAPAKGLPFSLLPVPAFGVQSHKSLFLLLKAQGVPWGHGLQESCLLVTAHPSQCTLLLMSCGKAWLPGQHHPPHLGTEGFRLPKLEQGKFPWTSPGMACSCPPDCWLTRFPSCFLIYLHHFPSVLLFLSLPFVS